VMIMTINLMKFQVKVFQFSGLKISIRLVYHVKQLMDLLKMVQENKYSSILEMYQIQINQGRNNQIQGEHLFNQGIPMIKVAMKKIRTIIKTNLMMDRQIQIQKITTLTITTLGITTLGITIQMTTSKTQVILHNLKSKP